MEKINSIFNQQPVLTSAALIGAGLVAYHNGWLNFVFSKPSKAGIVTPKTSAPATTTAPAGLRG